MVAGDESVDELTDQLSERIWEDFERLAPASDELRGLVGLLLLLPELERSADLAEHRAQHAVAHVGPDMSPLSRGIVQRMSDVALEMWHEAPKATRVARPLAPCLKKPTRNSTSCTSGSRTRWRQAP